MSAADRDGTSPAGPAVVVSARLLGTALLGGARRGDARLGVCELSGDDPWPGWALPLHAVALRLRHEP